MGKVKYEMNGKALIATTEELDRLNKALTTLYPLSNNGPYSRFAAGDWVEAKEEVITKICGSLEDPDNWHLEREERTIIGKIIGFVNKGGYSEKIVILPQSELGTKNYKIFDHHSVTKVTNGLKIALLCAQDAND